MRLSISQHLGIVFVTSIVAIVIIVVVLLLLFPQVLVLLMGLNYFWVLWAQELLGVKKFAKSENTNINFFISKNSSPNVYVEWKNLYLRYASTNWLDFFAWVCIKTLHGSQSQAFTHDMQVLRQFGDNFCHQPDQPKICFWPQEF